MSERDPSIQEDNHQRGISDRSWAIATGIGSTLFSFCGGGSLAFTNKEGYLIAAIGIGTGLLLGKISLKMAYNADRPGDPSSTPPRD